MCGCTWSNVFHVTDAGRAYALESLPPAPKPGKLTGYADFRRIGECYEDFASYLGIQIPAYEEWRQPLQHSAGYRMYRGSKWSEWGRDVQGEWAPTKTEAKASYKAVLPQRSATGCFCGAELAVSMSFACPPCAGVAKLLLSRSWMGAMRISQRRPADLRARSNRQRRDEVNQKQADGKPSLVAIVAPPIAPITLVATSVPSTPPLVISVMVPAIASAVVSAAAVPIVRSNNTAAQQCSGSNRQHENVFHKTFPLRVLDVSEEYRLRRTAHVSNRIKFRVGESVIRYPLLLDIAAALIGSVTFTVPRTPASTLTTGAELITIKRGSAEPEQCDISNKDQGARQNNGKKDCHKSATRWPSWAPADYPSGLMPIANNCQNTAEVRA